MRISIWAAAWSVSLVACVGGAPAAGGGNGPDGGSASVDGPGSDPTTPAVALSVDHATLSTDLGVDNTINLTATSVNGFAGEVDLVATAVDASGDPMGDWLPTLSSASVQLTAGGTQSVAVDVNLAGNVAQLMGTVQIAGVSTAADAQATIAVTANPVLTVTIPDDANGNCIYTNHPQSDPYVVTAGRQINVVNGSTHNLGLTVHVDVNAAADGFVHEGNTPTPAGQGYESDPLGSGDNDFYCHNGNPNTMTDPGTGGHMYLHIQ